MNFSVIRGLFISIPALFCFSCAVLLENSDVPENQLEIKAYQMRNGIEVWEDSTAFPFDNVHFTDEMKYINGANSGELEDKAVQYAKNHQAHGIFIYKRIRRNRQNEYDVGAKRGDLTVYGFDLEEQGIRPDSLHYGTTLQANATQFDLYVKYFVYKKPN
ncbi:MAG: hypothetical protein A2293_01875 [Elusimicrobia bacterium RIFOXYB2_FULL_49_7]|nr:MAG: hypothetical protein A2293_01875 [Elusimicrobia bacterium RIFOXYB2_FULL_49_7]